MALTRGNVCAFHYAMLFIIFMASNIISEAQTCNPNGKLIGTKPPPGICNTKNNSSCCEEGKIYNTYECSPPISNLTKAILTMTGFVKGNDGGPGDCDDRMHSDDTPVVALSTGWFSNGKRCLTFINIHGNGKSVKAMVVDECDSTIGCDAEHDFEPPCPNDIVDASKAVWKALGVPENDRTSMEITWSDA